VTLVCVLSVQEETGSLEKSPVRGKLFNSRAVFPGLVMATNSVVFGTLIPFIPLLAREKGLGDTAGGFYTTYAFFLIFSRALTGPLSDKYGRKMIVVPGMLGVGISLCFIASSGQILWFFIAIALYSLCAGTVQPSLMALAVDRAKNTERGSAMATFTLLNDLGITLGTFITGSLGPNIGYANTLWIIMALTLLGLLYYLIQDAVEQKAQSLDLPKGEACVG
jgi:MFS family permease